MYFYMFYLYHKKVVNALAKIYIYPDRVKRLIKENGLTMRFFNEKFGKNRSFLSNVLSGSDSITDIQLSYLADKLNTTPEYLKGETDLKEKPATETGSGQKAQKLLELIQQMNDVNLDFMIQLGIQLLEKQQKETSHD